MSSRKRAATKSGSIAAELAYSQTDQNRFSRLDSEDDNGLAGRLDYTQDWQLTKDSTSWLLQTEGHYEWVQSTYRSINPYRSPEFLRDWSLATINGVGSTTPAEEQLSGVGLALIHPKAGLLQYRFGSFTIIDTVKNGGKSLSDANVFSSLNAFVNES